MSRRPSPDEVFDWADTYTRERVAADRSTIYPTLAMAARKWGVTIEEIDEVIDEGTQKGYLGVGVALGNAVGHYTFKYRGECLVEAYV